jgi:cation diffusion facilitator CzcD-associated flavoprotein CzcO
VTSRSLHRHGRADGIDVDIAIVGSGFSGIGAAIELQNAGFHDYVILERAESLGGTWRDAHYPGLAVDMPSFIYSYPFALSPDWSRIYPTGDELLAYTQRCAREHGVDAHIRYGAEVISADWIGDARAWEISLADGERLRARTLVSASGLLVDPRWPDLPGLSAYGGELMHTGNWDDDVDLSGKRVAVIGTGASAVQLVPAIVDEVASLSVFQRTPIWLMGKPDAELSERMKRLFARLPFLQRAIRWAINVLVELTMGPAFVHYRRFPWMFDALERRLIASMREQVHDPEVQEKLIPEYSFFCKRPSFSNTYYPCFNREHVELVTEAIEAVGSQGIRTIDGVDRDYDVIICATGYSVFDTRCTPNFSVTGRDGVRLAEYWSRNRFQAYEGASVPGFPNFFLFMGPYSTAGASYFTMIDTQGRHLTRCLRAARRRGARVVEVKERAHAEDFERVLRRRENMVLFAGRCGASNSYYFDERGDVPGMRPVTGGQHWLRSRTFPLSAYRFEV